MIQINLFTEEKQTHSHRKQTYGYQTEKGGRHKLQVWDYQIQTTIYKIDKQQGPTIAQGTIFNIL